VAFTVVLCLALLGTPEDSAGSADSHLESTSATGSKSSIATGSTTTTSTASNHKPKPSSSSRQPRWHIFKYVNVVATLAFTASVAQFGLHSSYYMEHQGMLMNFLIGWSVFLCYFFGFFGISLIYNDIEALPGQPAPENTKERYVLRCIT